jgi:hypothetical protein
MSTVNPWVTPTTTQEPALVEPVVEASPATVRGVSRPQLGVRAPRVGLAAIPVSMQAPLWWVGAHGGAGVSTLAQLVPGSMGAGTAWPQPEYGEAHCALVCRSNLSGLRAAQTAMTQWASGAAPHGVQLLGLVVVADAPGRRLPRPLRDLTPVIAGGVPQVWHLGWSEAWRIEHVPSLDAAPRTVTSTIRELTDLTRSLATARGLTEEKDPR